MNRDSEHLACCFDAYCKRLLKNEVIDTIRGEKRMGQREVTFSDLTRAERNQLQYIDHYESVEQSIPAEAERLSGFTGRDDTGYPRHQPFEC